MKRIYKMAAFTTLLVSGQVVKSQTGPAFNRLSAGITLGHLYDVKFQPNKVLPSGFIAEDLKGLNGSNTRFDMGLGLNAGWHFSPVLKLDASFDMGKMSGAGEYEYYTSRVRFYSLGADWSIKRFSRNTPYSLVPYMRLSFGGAFYDARRSFREDERTFSSTSGNCLYSGVGLGVKYYVNNHISVNLVSEFVTVYTDAWDGYDNSNGYDRILRTRVGVNYTFGKGPHTDREPALSGINIPPQQAPVIPVVTAPDSTLMAMGVYMKQMKEELETLRKKIEEQDKTVTMPAPVDIEYIRSKLLIEINTIYFPTGAAVLDETAIRQLNKVASIMKDALQLQLTITGYADSVGESPLNQTLSLQRANAVAAYLVQSGVNPSQLVSVGVGEASPVDSRNDPGALANNRRVEFRVK